VGPRAGLDRCGKSRLHRESIPGPPARSSVAIPTELPGPVKVKESHYRPGEAYGGEERGVMGELRERDHWGDPGVDGRTMKTRPSRIGMCGYGLDRAGSG